MKLVSLRLCATLLPTLACADDSSGQLRVLLAAEETISSGLTAGDGEENTKDFSVRYTKYLVSVGKLSLARSEPRRSLVSDQVWIADMRRVGEEGAQLVSFDDLRPGQWSQFGFQTPLPALGFQKLPDVSDADAQEMFDKQLTHWIEGVVERPLAPVRFVFKVTVPTVYSSCETNGQPGVAIGADGASTATITLHGDHLWFDSLVRGNESTVTRRAAWLVAADVDGDGLVVTGDLAKLPAEVLFPSAEGYNLSGAPLPVANALDFVRGQLATQGHLNGEGECETALP